MNFLARIVSSALAIIIVAYMLKPHVYVDDALTAVLLAAQIITTGDSALLQNIIDYKKSLKEKVVKANEGIQKK